MGIKQTLGAIVLASAIGLTGCYNKPTEPGYINGIVQKETGTIVDRQKVIERSAGALFGNESIRFSDPTYAIQFKTDNGRVYTFQIIPYHNKLEALNLAINEGTKIRIKRLYFNDCLEGSVGRVYDDHIEVLGQK